MSRRRWILLAVICLFAGAFMFGGKALARSNDVFWSKGQCRDESGGRGHISAVQWACDWVNEPNESTGEGWYYRGPFCALWLGSPDDSWNTEAILYANSYSGTTTLTYYRMCWDGANGTAEIWVNNDNDSIDDSRNMSGGSWAWPSSMNTSVNVSRFISGIGGSRINVNGRLYDEYVRNVNVWRRAENTWSCDENGACSDMWATVRVRVLTDATLTGVAVDGSGNGIGLADVSATVKSGSSATISARSKAGWTFKGWRTNRYSGTPSGGGNYTATVTSNTTVYAVYEKQNRTLTGVAYTTAGASLSGKIANVSRTVPYGNSASITRNTHTCYDFKGWKNNISDTSYTAGTGATYTVGSLTSNITRYAIYQIKSLTLTGQAVDSNGNSLASVMSDVTSRVNCGSSASITRRTADGYTFLGWRTNRTSGTPSGGATYTVNPLNGSSVVYAVYTRNSFQGQARASAGTTITGSISSTGYRNSANTVTKAIDCVNGGCDGAMDLYIKTVAGSGATGYNVGTSNNGGGITWVPATGMTSVTPSTGGTRIGLYTKRLTPGQSTCRYLKFKPYGGLGNTATATVGACVSAKVTNFKGRSSVSGTASGNTGFVNTNTSRTYFINNCSAASGCKVKFSHELQRSDSTGSTPYTISRTSNFTTTSRGIASNGSIKTGTFNTNSGTVNTSGDLTLYPGMVVCETMVFKPNNNTVSVAGNVSTTVCASALGNAQPGDPGNPDAPEDPNQASGDTSYINIKVRNKNVTKYANYQRTVYAKPGDKLTYRATYNPVLQYTYNLKPQQMRINGGTIFAGGGSTLGALFNAKKGSNLRNWNNGFSTQLAYNNNFNSATLLKNATYTVGDFNKRAETHDYNAASGVLTSDVGKTIDEKAITNLNATTQTTPNQVTFTNNSNNNLGNVITNAQNRVATARVPYNFNTAIEVKTPTETPIYAGELTTISFDITLKPKRNNETMNSGDKDYATNVGNPKYKIVVYQGPQKAGGEYGSDNLCGYYGLANNETNCGYSAEGNDVFRSGINTNANMVKTLTRTFGAQDMKAGSSICVAAAFWPASSGTDTNLNPDGSGTWRISDSKCYKIAKKPNLQIWGGNFYSSGNVNAAVSVKNHVLGFTDYKVGTPRDESYVFGTWVESGLASSGEIKGVASGAYMGYTANDNGNLIATPGGSKEKRTEISSCIRSVLTFANYPCTRASGLTGSLGNTTSVANANKDKSSIIANFAVSKRDENGNDLNLVSGEVSINDDAKINSTGTYYYHNDSDNLVVPGSTIVARALQLVASGKSVMISGDIISDASVPYANIDEMPKLVIYAKDNIYIDCNVGRIDAILIADGAVMTCANDGFATSLDSASIKAKINQAQNSKQLVINGTVIADQFIANRTYGAATGANSIVPAEIINYDGTNYAWSNWTGSETTIDDMKITYTKELSPRY